VSPRRKVSSSTPSKKTAHMLSYHRFAGRLISSFLPSSAITRDSRDDSVTRGAAIASGGPNEARTQGGRVAASSVPGRGSEDARSPVMMGASSRERRRRDWFSRLRTPHRAASPKEQASSSDSFALRVKGAAIVRVAAASVVLVGAGAFLMSSPAQAAPTPHPGWRITSRSYPTNLPPGGHGYVAFDLFNVGAEPSSGDTIVSDTLPPGLVFTGVVEEQNAGGTPWSCEGSEIVRCTQSGDIPAGEEQEVALEVEVGNVEAALENRVTVTEGGALGSATSTTPIVVASTASGFGLASQEAWATDGAGVTETRAASHPYEFTVAFGLNNNLEASGQFRPHPSQSEFRDTEVSVPPGLVGNPEAIPQCARAQFAKFACPAESQIGVDVYYAGNFGHVLLPIYNLVPPVGLPAQFAFGQLGIKVFFNAAVRSDGDYGITEHIEGVPQRDIVHNTATIWGVPAEPSHDPQRCALNEVSGSTECGLPSDGARVPFLRLPTSCGAPPAVGNEVDGWNDPEVFKDFKQATYADADGNPLGLSACNAVGFTPSIEAKATTTKADSPTGLNVNLTLPQNEEPEGLGESDLKGAVVKLPAGLSVDPSSANGLGACTSAQIGLTTPVGQTPIHFTDEPADCPTSSSIGTVTLETPLVGHPLPGTVYLAKQFDNPFDSLLAIYVVVDDPETGVIVKLPGRVEADPTTGQLTATFTENPQLPFEHLHVDFFGGTAAPLRSPSTCGSYQTTTDLTPWTTPEGADAHPADSFQVSEAAGGGGCANTEAALPNKPSFSAGTLSPQAGTYSPFLLKIARSDGSQQLSRIDTTLPPGLLGKLAGIPYCPESGIAQAENRSKPGEGALEQSSPSCPAASQVGAVEVGAGAGPTPFYATGKAYLAGPYKGAPLSLVVITPAVAGPFDLGDVVVRTALQVDELTAQIHAVSDPFPTILHGIPLDLRSISIEMDRSQFTLNPTNCDPLSVLGSATSTLGQAASLSDPFQVVGCNALGFKPSLKISLKGKTKRTGHPALKAVLTYPNAGAYANIARAQVSLPHSELLDQGNLDKVCTQPELKTQTCPSRSVYGKAKAWSPLLEKPLEGPVYLAVGFGYKLPALVAELNGQIRVLLKGKIDTDSEDGIRNTFEAVPDAPVSRFVLEMKGGKKYGLLENSENICQKPQKAGASFTAQNGKLDNFKQSIANSCGSKGNGKGKKHQAKKSGRGGK
jgi:hypothetical protein